MAEVNLACTSANCCKWEAMRRNTCTSDPLCSPARTMLIYRSEKMDGCFCMASERLRPSVTSVLRSLLTSEEMPLLSKCVMLFRATVRGMPDCSRLASWFVKVASSCILGLRFSCILARRVGGRKDIRLMAGALVLPSIVTRAPAFAASTARGNSPSR